MLVEIAIADAYGHGFEYAPPDDVRRNDGATHHQHPRHLKLTPGMYTDDAQMSLANAELLLEDAADFRPIRIAEAWLRAFKRDPRDGYARGFQAFLEGVSDAEDFLARIRPDSAKGGAAMRAGVFGLLEDERAVLDGAAAQAALTHLTPVGIASAQGAALMVHHQARGLGPISALPGYLAARVPSLDWSRPHRGKVGQDGGELVRAALGVLLDSKSLREVLIRSVALGGDTDTTAAVAMAPAAVSAELARDLPESLHAELEDGPYGLRFLASIDRRLAERFGLPAVSAGGGLR